MNKKKNTIFYEELYRIFDKKLFLIEAQYLFKRPKLSDSGSGVTSEKLSQAAVYLMHTT